MGHGVSSSDDRSLSENGPEHQGAQYNYQLSPAELAIVQEMLAVAKSGGINNGPGGDRGLCFTIAAWQVLYSTPGLRERCLQSVQDATRQAFNSPDIAPLLSKLEVVQTERRQVKKAKMEAETTAIQQAETREEEKKKGTWLQEQEREYRENRKNFPEALKNFDRSLATLRQQENTIAAQISRQIMGMLNPKPNVPELIGILLEMMEKAGRTGKNVGFAEYGPFLYSLVSIGGDLGHTLKDALEKGIYKEARYLIPDLGTAGVFDVSNQVVRRDPKNALNTKTSWSLDLFPTGDEPISIQSLVDRQTQSGDYWPLVRFPDVLITTLVRTQPREEDAVEVSVTPTLRIDQDNGQGDYVLCALIVSLPGGGHSIALVRQAGGEGGWILKDGGISQPVTRSVWDEGVPGSPFLGDTALTSNKVRREVNVLFYKLVQASSPGSISSSQSSSSSKE